MSDLEAAKAATKEQARLRERVKSLESAIGPTVQGAQKAAQAASGISAALGTAAFEATARRNAPTLREAADAFLRAAAAIDDVLREAPPAGE